jgi:hypothetical protein
MKLGVLRYIRAAIALAALAGWGAQNAPPPPSPGPTGAAAAAAGPRIQFAAPVFDFGKVDMGALIKHDFVFTNTGDATLEIKDVRTTCGCTTTTNWGHRIEPDKTGAIPIRFDTANYGGQVSKSLTIICNDVTQSNVVLRFKGTVFKPIDLIPPTVYFNVLSEAATNETRLVRIVSHLEEPLTLSEPECTNLAFKAELKTVQPGKEFALHVTSLPPKNVAMFAAPITIKTSSPRVPVLTLNALAVVQQPVTVMPSKLALPPGPLTSPLRPSITIRNNGTNALALSDASVNTTNAGVQVKEIQPGRLFSLTLNLPAGFEIKPDQKVVVSVKSTHPKFPLITVPVYQQLRAPGGPVAASGPAQAPAIPGTVALPPPVK